MSPANCDLTIVFFGFAIREREGDIFFDINIKNSVIYKKIYHFICIDAQVLGSEVLGGPFIFVFFSKTPGYPLKNWYFYWITFQNSGIRRCGHRRGEARNGGITFGMGGCRTGGQCYCFIAGLVFLRGYLAYRRFILFLKKGFKGRVFFTKKDVNVGQGRPGFLFCRRGVK